MAQIAEDLFLLLLDNASAQPGLDRRRRERVLAAAVLLDLAYACRIRPALPDEPVEPGLLIALEGNWPADPVSDPALQLLRRRPLSAEAALAKLGKSTQPTLELHLENIGQIHRVRLPGKGFRASYCWPLTNRERAGVARAALLGALFDGQNPAPAIAAIICLLHAVDGLGAVLSLNERGWRWVHARATEITTGAWVDDTAAGLPEMNLAVTTATVRPALMG
ncbi:MULTISPECIES: GOLPH3/VPS74 family protein [unclassified Mycolicibacterium]|uniref:GOLPH3/VPS74 family protein n=1 Tax=unclassified Mycolicibacterium TaxID=2636767 RepID=UPI002EDB48CE